MEADDPRRRLLINGLAAGLFGATLPWSSAQAQGSSIFGEPPSKLPPGQSFYRIVGQVKVNGKEANLKTLIAPGDVVETGKNSEAVFVVGGNAMIVRADSRLEIAGEKKESGFFVSALRILSGKMLSVSRNQPTTITTKTATIGIRGTGWYIESDPDLTYFCTCYGVTDVSSIDDPTSKDTVAASHHDRPLIITADGQKGKKIQNAGFKNHTDQELMLIETLVGRTTPFVFPGKGYTAPRKGY
jgi:hypothetical protein